MRKLAASGGDTFLNITTPKFSAQAIAAIAKSDWKPLHILNNVGASKKLVLEPVGLENAKDIVSMAYFKDPEDPQWADDAAMKEYKAGMKQHQPKADPLDTFCTYGWSAASTMIEALKAMKEPTREALMESVRNMDVEIPTLLPGIKVTTTPGRRLSHPGQPDHEVQRRELGAAGRRDPGRDLSLPGRARRGAHAPPYSLA